MNADYGATARAEAAERFVAALVPSMVVAMSGTKLAAYLNAEGPQKVEAAQRAAVIDGMVAEGPRLSRQGQDQLRRAALRIASDRPQHVAWTSMSTTRGAIGLGLWQTALEIAVAEGGQRLCATATGETCRHDDNRFKDSWGHFIGASRRLNDAEAGEMAAAYRAADARILLRHRLLHGKATPEDAATLESDTFEALIAPIIGLRQKVVEVTLRLVYDDPDPARTAARAMFHALEMPQELLDEVL